MTLTPYLPALLAPLIMWRVYSRYKRMVGVQKVRPVRLWLSVTLFPLLYLLMLLATKNDPLTLAAQLGGGVLGMVLAFYGLQLTQYHDEDDNLRYTPNAMIGMALTMLMVGRMSYRLVQMYTAGDLVAAQAGGAQGIHQSPLTMFIFGMVIAYYPTYSLGIMRWKNRVIRARAGQAVAPSELTAPVDAA
jgi:hypothetical protein